jgi:4-hydroxy-tetrahydrodipicolinate reductase
VCERVEAGRGARVEVASRRRRPVPHKIGAGLTPAEFLARVDAGTVRHVGLTESIAMIADAFGWKLDRITDEIEPKIAAETVSSEFLTVEKGRVAGIVQDGVGYRNGDKLITLHMEAYLGAPESYDAVRITGSPAIYSRVEGGIHGDIATASITVNSIPAVLSAGPGLHTMRTLRLPSYFGGK